MKKTFVWLTGTILFMSVFVACTDESKRILSGELEEIIVSTDHFISENATRAFYLSNNEVEFTWADGDTIGIFPNEGAQAYFPILTNGEESSSASFTGGGWALKPSSTYAAYYPFIGNFYIKKDEVPISYIGQKQTGNSSMEHLSAYDFMAASASTPENGRVNFHLKHLGSFVQLKITMPQGGSLSSVTLSAEEALFVTKGTIDVTATNPTIKAIETSNTLTLDVENVTTTAESPVATLYMMLAPVDFTDKTLSALVRTSDGQSETITLTSKNFEKGKAYEVSGTMNDPNDDDTTDNGTYKDGVVSLAKAGTMEKLLGSDYLSITSLKVEGSINGDDIYYLRKMLGASNFNETEKGKLTTLDLSEASIVEGGECYYESPSKQYYTSNNAIGDYMFNRCTNLQNIVLPVGVTSIGYATFEGCSSLNSVTIGDGITSISAYAFYDCSSLSSVHITDLSAWCKITFGSYNSTPLYHGAKLYLNNQELTELVIPEGITKINNYAFYECSSITSIDIPDRVTSIGEEAFGRCSSLISVTMGDGVSSISNHAFNSCSSLTSVIMGNGITSIGDNAFSYCSSLSSIDIPNGVTSIGNSTFYNCSSLTSATMGNGVTSIGDNAFSYCSSLSSIDIPDGVSSIGFQAFSYCSSLTSVTMDNGITSIGDGAFYKCSSLNSIEIPNGVTSIGISTFDGCSSLTSVTMSNKITSISSNAFSGCSSLNSIVISNGVTSIDSFAFSGCSSLNSIDIPDGVVSIGDGAFYNCLSLSSIDIPDGVTSISSYTFEGCSSLKDVYCYATTPPILYNYSFPYYGELTTLHIPTQCGTKYRSSSWGNHFKTIVEMD